MKNILLLLFIFTSITSFSQSETKQKIAITKGETIFINNISIKFVKVIEDSRCPKNATCIWQGRAIVQVEITQKGYDSIYKDIIFGAVRGIETGNKTLLNLDDFFIEAISLEPYPVVDTKKEEYVLWICEGK